ncbi:MAG TPA: aminotransferase class I/II-fold pyridoxal phosphate-dependent enzyme [Thermoanaerobaculia bacterium]
MHFDTRAIHAGNATDKETGAVAPPIHLSTTFEQETDASTPRGYGYIREANPTQSRLEQALAAIDSGEASLAFASGMAAGAAVLQALPAGSQVVFPDDCYYAYRLLAHDCFARWSLTYDIVAMEDLDAVRAALKPETQLLWAESPSNPLMKIVDLAALASLAKENRSRFLVDGTFATPALQRPIELGADVVLHSTTKYLGGHSDVQGGALTFAKKDALHDSVEHVRTLTGGVASPFNSWLVMRGIRSLSARMRVHCENAMALAAFLETHPRVERVHYPGLPSHPRHDVAARQMSGFGGMLSFLVRGGKEEALAVTAKVKVFTRATSLGGVESLIEHRASSEGPSSTTPANLLRLSVGLEHLGDLRDDLAAALA